MHVADLAGMRDWIDGLDGKQRGALAVAAFVVLIGVALMLWPVTSQGGYRTVNCGPAIVASIKRVGYADCRGDGRERLTMGFILLLMGATGGAIGVALMAPPSDRRLTRGPSMAGQHRETVGRRPVATQSNGDGMRTTILIIQNRDAVVDEETRRFLRDVPHPWSRHGSEERHFFAYEPVDGGTAQAAASQKARGNVWVEHGQVELLPGGSWAVAPDGSELPRLDLGRVMLGGPVEV